MGDSSVSTKSSRFRWVAGGLAIAAIAIVSGSIVTSKYFHADQAAAGPAAPEQAVAVTVAVVEPRQTNLWDEFSGRLEAVNRVELRPRVAGAIQSTGFAEGGLVKSGDVLFKIDPAPYQAEVEKAQAQLEAAKARAVFTNGELERGQQLIGNHVVTQRDLDQRDNAYREAVANVKAAEATLQTAKLNLDYTEVRAPVDGRVGRIEVTVGNLVSAGTSSPVLTTLVSVNPIYASFDADEDVVMRALQSIGADARAHTQLDRIPVQMTTVSSNGTAIEGRLQLIDNQVDARSGTVRVRAVFDNADGNLMPGQFARLRMGQPKTAPALMVNERAVGTDQDKRFVLVVDADNKAEYREVTLGASVDGLRVVTRGLKPGERIVVNGLQRVRPGALVAPQSARMDLRPEMQAQSRPAAEDVVAR
jgi:multidrug efflux system membrane fusion protein